MEKLTLQSEVVQSTLWMFMRDIVTRRFPVAREAMGYIKGLAECQRSRSLCELYLAMRDLFFSCRPSQQRH